MEAAFLFSGTPGMYWVYILKSEASGEFYVGHTQDVDARLQRHNAGLSRYTRGRGPWALVYQEAYETRGHAMHRERQIKSWKSRNEIAKLIAAWQDGGAQRSSR